MNLSDGFSMIPNHVLEAILIHEFTGKEKDMLMVIWRYSYGFQQEEALFDYMGDFQIYGISSNRIGEMLRSLEERNVVEVDWDRGAVRFNDDFTTWDVPMRKQFDAGRRGALLKLNTNRDIDRRKGWSKSQRGGGRPKKEEKNRFTKCKPVGSQNVNPNLGLQNENQQVYKMKTKDADKPNDSNGLQAPKERINKDPDIIPDPVCIDPDQREEQSPDFSKKEGKEKKQRTMREILMRKRKGDRKWVIDDMLHAVNRIYPNMAQKANIEHEDILWQLTDYPGATISAAASKVAEMEGSYAGKIYQLYREVTGNEYRYENAGRQA